MNKQLICMFVGSDMTGKTHIAKEFCKRSGIPYFKASSEHANFLKTPERFILNTQFADTRTVDVLKQTGLSIVFDRSYCCEWVYSQFFSRARDLETLRYLDEEYAKLGAKIIITRRKSYEGIVDDLDARLDSKALTVIDGLYQQFAEHFTKCEWKYLYVDDENLDREVDEVTNFVYDRESEFLSLCRNYNIVAALKVRQLGTT